MTSENRQVPEDQGPQAPPAAAWELRGGQLRKNISSGRLLLMACRYSRGGRRWVTPTLSLPLSRAEPHHRQVRRGAACTEWEPLTTTELIMMMANSLLPTQCEAFCLLPKTLWTSTVLYMLDYHLNILWSLFMSKWCKAETVGMKRLLVSWYTIVKCLMVPFQ